MIRIHKLVAIAILALASAAAAGASDWTWTVTSLDGLGAARDDHDGLELLYGARLLNERAQLGSALHVDGGAAVELDGDAYADALFGFHAIRPIGTRFDGEPAADPTPAGFGFAWSASPSCATGDACAASTGEGRKVVDFDAAAALGTAVALLPETVLSFRFRF